MANRELATKIRMLASALLALDGNETNAGPIVDTREANEGVTIFAMLSAWTDGTHTLLIEHGDAANLSDAVAVPAANRVDGAALPALGAAQVAGAVVSKVGVFGTKRYVRASFVSTGVTTGATGHIMTVMGGDLTPTDKTVPG